MVDGLRSLNSSWVFKFKVISPTDFSVDSATHFTALLEVVGVFHLVNSNKEILSSLSQILKVESESVLNA